MKLTSILFTILIILSFSGCETNNSSHSSYSRSKGKVDHSRTEEEIKTDLKTREQMSPLDYLSTDGTYRKNLLGEMVLEGTISNSATLASYKDVTLWVTGYSKTNSEVGKWEEIVYEVIKPGMSKKFKIKWMLPKAVKSVNWEIHAAIALK